MAQFILLTNHTGEIRVNVEIIAYYEVNPDAETGSVVTLISDVALVVRETPAIIDRLIDPTSTPR